MNKPKLWTKDFLIVSFVNLFFALNFYLLMVVISVYAMDKFDSSPSEAGLTVSLFVIGALIARLFTGKWIERIGRKKTLYIGLISGLAMTSLYFVVNTFISLLVIRFLHGAAFGITSTATGTIVASIVPQERRGEGIGYFALSITLATAIGPFLGMFISQHGSFNMIFIACAIVAILSLFITFFLSVSEIKLTEEQEEGMKEFKFNNFFEPKAIPISIVIMVIYLCYSSILAFLAIYSKVINLVDAASFFFIVYAVAAFFSRPFIGRLFDSKGENLVMYSAILIFMIGMVIFSQAYYGHTLLLAGAFIGLGFGGVQSIGQAISIKVTSPHRMGLATSTFYIFADMGTGIGPFIFGLFIPFISYRGVYLGVAIIAGASMFLYYLLHGKKSKLRHVENSSET